MRGYLLALSLIAAYPAAAVPIFRCTDAFGGSVSYQEAPCATAAGGATTIPTQFPDYAGPRDRLAAREAAVDARLLERMRIESAERIARDERMARQAQLEAERERSQATDAWVPVYGGPVYARPGHRARVHPRNKLAH
jgi:hypothetical protein